MIKKSDHNDPQFISDYFREYCQILKKMFLIRNFEKTVSDLIENGKITTPCHLYIGQEAVASTVCLFLKKADWVFSTHRSHGHYIAKGGDIKKLMAELFCKNQGCCKGKGGSMHIADQKNGLPGSSAIVAGTLSLAVGAALSFSIQKKKSIVIVFFGDGATNEGVFFESLNFASLKKLPILFVCENNLYSTHMPLSEISANNELFKFGEVFNIPSSRISGNDVTILYPVVQKYITHVQSGNGPCLLECMTYRHCGHVGPKDDIEKGLRSSEELKSWITNDPIDLLTAKLINTNQLSIKEINEMSINIYKEVDMAVKYAESSSDPEYENLMENIYYSSKNES